MRALRLFLLAFCLSMMTGCRFTSEQPATADDSALGEYHRVTLSDATTDSSVPDDTAEFVVRYSLNHDPYFVIWTDSSRCRNGVSKSPLGPVRPCGTVIYRNHDGMPDQEVEFSGEFKDGQGKITIDGNSYDLANGALLLVARVSGEVRVKQLERDLESLTYRRDALVDYRNSDPEIRTFFAKSTIPWPLID